MTGQPGQPTATPTTTPTTPAAGRFFNTTLNAPTPRIERNPITVRFSQVTGNGVAAPRTSDPIEPIPLADVTESTPANCFLQLWEMDEYRVGTYFNDEETDRRAMQSNSLITAIPGFLVRRATTVFEFQLPQTFTRPTFDRALASSNGFIRVKLRDAGDDFRILNIHMPEFENFFELGACLRLDAADLSYASLRSQPPFQVRNEIASMRRQIAQRNGITVGISGNWRTGTATNGNPTFTNGNDAEFERQAEDNLDVLPAFVPDTDRQAKIGYHLFEQTGNGDLAEIAGFIRKTREAVGLALAQNDLFLDAAAQALEEEDSSASQPPLVQCPRMATLFFYCHGWRNGMTIAGDGAASRQTRVANIATWVTAIAPHCARNLVVALFACNCGRGLLTAGTGSGSDPTMGMMWPAEMLGADSFGWTLFRTLRANGVADPCIWAHTTAAHACRNPFLRVFCPQGTADGVSLILETPRINRFRPFINRFTVGDGWVHRGNMLRELCTIHAGYLPWAWNGGTTITHTTPWFNAALAADVNLMFQSIVAAAQSDTVAVAEEVLFEDITRQYIFASLAPSPSLPPGPNTPVFDPNVTRSFKVSHLSFDAEPFRISVRLLQAMQLICDRVAINNAATATPLITIDSITDDGNTAVIKGKNASQRSRLATQANTAITEQFLTFATSLSDNRLLVSVNPTSPTLPETSTTPAVH